MSAPLHLALALALASAACAKDGPIEPAPLVGGETITYTLDSSKRTVTFKKKGEGFTIETSDNAAPPQDVAANLRNGREKVKALDLGLIWLEPSQRKVGGQTHLGNIVKEDMRARRPTWKMAERNGAVEYWFDKKTGFLVERRVNPSGPTTTFISSTIKGL